MNQLLYNFEDYYNVSKLFEVSKITIKQYEKQFFEYVLESGLFYYYRRKRFVEYQYESWCKGLCSDWIVDEEDYYALNILYDLDDHTIYLLDKMYNSHRQKVLRLKHRIESMLSEDCVFLTFTFSDDFLNNTSDKTRRVYVSRFLRSHTGSKYVANIDFGQDDNFTKREHYHGLIQCSKVDFSLWKCGLINGEKVIVNNAEALAKYINKLSYHAYKDGASSTNLIYSKNK